MGEDESLAIMVVIAAFFIGMTLLIAYRDGNAEKSAIEQGYIILEGDKYRLERVE